MIEWLFLPVYSILLILQRQLLSLCLVLLNDSTGACQSQDPKRNPWAHIYSCVLYAQSIQGRILNLSKYNVPKVIMGENWCVYTFLPQ